MPLRHLAYPGDVSWTEEGHLFSWHMKLRDKEATASFTVRDPETGESWTVSPRDHLTRRQASKMSGNPDLILQFAHYLAERDRRSGGSRLEVRASVNASLNGREPQPLVDPDTDLAAQPRSLRASPWIVPLYQPYGRRHRRSPRPRATSRTSRCRSRPFTGVARDTGQRTGNSSARWR
jgi:hypothetical protein